MSVLSDVGRGFFISGHKGGAMDWLIKNVGTIFSFVSLALVAAVWGYVTYGRNRERLERDLQTLLSEALSYVKDWAKSVAFSISPQDVATVANEVYDRFVQGTPLAKLVSREQFASLLWEAYVRWRDQFVALEIVRANLAQ